MNSVPTVAEAILYPMLQDAVTKGFFGKAKIRFGDFLQITGYLYESFALTSRALIDKTPVLEELIGNPENPGGALTYMKGQATERRNKFPAEHSFSMFVMTSELARMNLSVSNIGTDARVNTALDHKWDVTEIKGLGEMLCLEGIGFGLQFPEETREMYRQTYEEFDLEQWDVMFKVGVVSTPQPLVYPLEDRERDVLSFLSEYVHQFRPDLEVKLGLAHLLT